MLKQKTLDTNRISCRWSKISHVSEEFFFFFKPVMCCSASATYRAVCQPAVEEREAVCLWGGGNQTSGERRSKTEAEQDPVSKMSLEGSPSSLHPAFPPPIIDPKENKLNPMLNYRLRPGSGDGLAAGCTELYTLAAASVASPRRLIKINIKHFATDE